MLKRTNSIALGFMLIASFALVGTAVATDEYPSEVTLFKNVNIFDGVSEQLKMGYDVLVVGNKIHKIDKDIPSSGNYEVEVFYTCPPTDVGSVIELSFGDTRVTGNVSPAHDPPLYGMEADRVERRGESYVKDFRPLALGTLPLHQGRGPLTLRALSVPGSQVMDVRMIVLTLRQ